MKKLNGCSHESKRIKYNEYMYVALHQQTINRSDMNFFKKNKDLDKEQYTIHSVIPRFSKIIDKWLTIRDESNNMFWHEKSEEDNFFPKYVMRMMHEINNEMPKPMLDKIKSKEICAMGHVDYAHKFALYCAELYLNEA